MNSYPQQWVDDFNNIFYSVREQMKHDAWDKLSNSELPMKEKVCAAEQVIKSHFLRSAYSFIETHGYKRRHPSFEEYAAMMLNQERYRELFSKDVAAALVDKYGMKKGIPSGSYFLIKNQ